MFKAVKVNVVAVVDSAQFATKGCVHNENFLNFTLKRISTHISSYMIRAILTFLEFAPLISSFRMM